MSRGSLKSEQGKTKQKRTPMCSFGRTGVFIFCPPLYCHSFAAARLACKDNYGRRAIRKHIISNSHRGEKSLKRLDSSLDYPRWGNPFIFRGCALEQHHRDFSVAAARLTRNDRPRRVIFHISMAGSLEGQCGNLLVRKEENASRRLSRAHALIEPHAIASQIREECIPAYTRNL